MDPAWICGPVGGHVNCLCLDGKSHHGLLKPEHDRVNVVWFQFDQHPHINRTFSVFSGLVGYVIWVYFRIGYPQVNGLSMMIIIPPIETAIWGNTTFLEAKQEFQVAWHKNPSASSSMPGLGQWLDSDLNGSSVLLRSWQGSKVLQGGGNGSGNVAGIQRNLPGSNMAGGITQLNNQVDIYNHLYILKNM